MSNSSEKKTPDKNLSREDRLAKNLRDNLRRRKQAARKSKAEDKAATGTKT